MSCSHLRRMTVYPNSGKRATSNIKGDDKNLDGNVRRGRTERTSLKGSPGWHAVFLLKAS